MQIHTDIEINAAPETVWNVLTDFAVYGDWNPVIPSITGAPYVGEKISFKIRAMPGVEIPIVACEVLVASASARELRWRGPAIPLVDQVLAGEHYFIIQDAGPNKVRFVHGENFTGLIVGVLEPLLQQRITDAYSEMNRALKARCESKR